jgi:hypothetical protein
MYTHTIFLIAYHTIGLFVKAYQKLRSWYVFTGIEF